MGVQCMDRVASRRLHSRGLPKAPRISGPPLNAAPVRAAIMSRFISFNIGLAAQLVCRALTSFKYQTAIAQT